MYSDTRYNKVCCRRLIVPSVKLGVGGWTYMESRDVEEPMRAWQVGMNK
jgi:hypothetical protein